MAWSDFLLCFPFASDREVQLTEPKTPTTVWCDLSECAYLCACMYKCGLSSRAASKLNPRRTLSVGAIFLWYFCVISLDQNNNKQPGPNNKVQERWTTTTPPVPRHSTVTSYGHILKVENDEKQSNTPEASLWTLPRGSQSTAVSASQLEYRTLRPPASKWGGGLKSFAAEWYQQQWQWFL